MKELIMRKAKKDDLKDIISLYQQESMDNGKAISLTKANTLFAKMQGYPDYSIFVASTDTNEIVGVFCLLIMDNLGHSGTPSAIVEGVCVQKNIQGKGIGRKMMSHAKVVAEQSGCYKLALTSNINRHSAHHFYQSLGFKQHGISFELIL
ncbi:MAG: GNAT family N-acetyltransferase [Cellvibrionaceae bacterium]